MFTLRQARLMREKTQQEMADVLKIHRSTYIALEANPGNATVSQARAICDFLGFSFDEIFFGA